MLTSGHDLTVEHGWKLLHLPAADGRPGARLVIDLFPHPGTPAAASLQALLPFPPGIRVVLDPGHGGGDPGFVGGAVEKDVTLAVAQRVRTLLTAAGVHVTLTRETDRHLDAVKAEDLRRRAALAVSPASLFVSIHANAARPERLAFGYGVKTFWSPGSPRSSALAGALQASVVGWTSAFSRGVRDDQVLQVLRSARVPAALVEIGFLSHPEEGFKLRDGVYLDQVALGLAWGVRNFLLPAEAQISPLPPSGEASGRKPHENRAAVWGRPVGG